MAKRERPLQFWAVTQILALEAAFAAVFRFRSPLISILIWDTVGVEPPADGQQDPWNPT